MAVISPEEEARRREYSERVDAYIAERESRRPNLDKPCYAPSFHCVTHECSIDTCWSVGRCDAHYALNKS